jgi:hypothetical protein
MIIISNTRYHQSAVVVMQLLLLTLLYWLSAPRFWYDFGPDFVSYTSIARHYGEGNWVDAVNTWWSPLYSWLLAAMLKFFPDPLLANKVLQFVFAVAGWWVFRRLLFFHLKKERSLFAEGLLAATIPFWVYWGLRSDTPDLISAVLLLYFVSRVLRLHYQLTYTTALLTGVTGALAYLAKAYNFYILIFFSLALIVITLFRHSNRRAVIQYATVTAASFLLLCFLWMAAMHGKNGQWQISGIGLHPVCENEWVLMVKPHTEVYDCAGLQLHAGNRVSDWETPAVYGTMNVKSYLFTNPGETLGKAALNTADYFQNFSSGYQWILLAILLLCCGGMLKKWWWLYGLFFGLYMGGYALFHLEARFFIITGALQMLLIAVLLVNLAQHYAPGKIAWLPVLAVAFLFARWPMQNLLRFDAGTTPRKIARFAQQHLPENKAPQNIIAAAGLFEEGLYYAFFTGNRFYGALQKSGTPWQGMLGKEIMDNDMQQILIKTASGEYKLLSITVKLNSPSGK